MTLLTIEYKLVSVPYFLDEMQYFELVLLMDNINVSVKNDWTIAREVMWSNLRPWSKGNLKAEDVMKFPWENSTKLPKVEVTEELRQKMLQDAEASKQQLIDAGLL